MLTRVFALFITLVSLAFVSNVAIAQELDPVGSTTHESFTADTNNFTDQSLIQQPSNTPVETLLVPLPEDTPTDSPLPAASTLVDPVPMAESPPTSESVENHFIEAAPVQDQSAIQPYAEVAPEEEAIRPPESLVPDVVPAPISGEAIPSLHSWEWPDRGYHLPSNLPVRGQSMYYSPGVMQRVIALRTRWRQISPCAECIGYVALLRVGDINRRVWLQMKDGSVEGPFLVVDVAAKRDIPRLLRLGWVVDVDWETAQRWNKRMPVVTVLDAPPE